MTILLPGSTGTSGAEIDRQLVAAGAALEALLRSREKRRRLPEGVEVVECDMNDSASLDRANRAGDCLRPSDGFV